MQSLLELVGIHQGEKIVIEEKEADIDVRSDVQQRARQPWLYFPGIRPPFDKKNLRGPQQPDGHRIVLP